MAFGIIELLTRVGEDKIVFQSLFDGQVDIQWKKNGEARVAFYTNQVSRSAAIGEPDRVALVVWLPREDVRRAQQEHDDAQVPRMALRFVHDLCPSRDILDALVEALGEADATTSRLHDVLYSNDFDLTAEVARAAANDLVWQLHGELRAALQRARERKG